MKQVLGIALVCFVVFAEASQTDKDAQSQHCVVDESIRSSIDVPSCQYTNQLHFPGAKQAAPVYLLKEMAGTRSLFPHNLSVFSVSISELPAIPAKGQMMIWGGGMTASQKQQVCGLINKANTPKVTFLMPVEGLRSSWEEETISKVYTGRLGLNFSEQIPEAARISLLRNIPVKATSEYLDKVLVVESDSDRGKRELSLAKLEEKVQLFRALENGRGQVFASCGKVVNVLD